jgi:hypothetical protein
VGYSVIEFLFLFISYHFDRQAGYNEKNPGMIVAADVHASDYFRIYGTGGAYLDSYRRWSTLAGVGCDVGENYGVGLTLAHISGSSLERHAVVPVPSVFVRWESCTARVILSPKALAFGLSYRFKP